MKYYPSGFRASLCLLYALFWVCIVQSEPSAAVRVSIDRRGGFTLKLSCKQGHPETMADPAPHIPKYLIHPFKRPRANFSAAACWIPNKSTGPKALNRAMKTRMQVAGVEFSAIHTFQTSQTKHTHTHFSPSSFPCFSKAICREEESTRKRRPFVPRYFCMREESMFCLWDNTVLPLRL